jgi:hypothetical protein
MKVGRWLPHENITASPFMQAHGHGHVSIAIAEAIQLDARSSFIFILHLTLLTFISQSLIVVFRPSMDHLESR